MSLPFRQISSLIRPRCLLGRKSNFGLECAVTSSSQIRWVHALATAPLTSPSQETRFDITKYRLSNGPKSKVTVVIGAQWGDEGKGKIVDYLAVNSDVVCRCQGGSNAEHAAVVDGKVYHFRLLPVGFLNKNAKCLIGNGVVVHTPYLMQELEYFEKLGYTDWANRLVISDRAHMVFDFHQDVDVLQELERKTLKLGTIKKGVGPAYSSKVFRSGIRFGDLVGDFNVFKEKFTNLVEVYHRMFPGLQVNIPAELETYKVYAEKLRPVVQDSINVMHGFMDSNLSIVVEGANASMLDIDFGTYPFVTSSNTTVGGVCTGLGIPPSKIGSVYGVIKSYTARYGTGPFPTHLDNALGDWLETNEIVTPPARKIRCGWIDLAALNYTNRINDYNAFALTKLDTYDTLESIKVGVGYMLNGEPLGRFPSSDNELSQVEVEYVTLPGWKCSTQEARRWEDLPKEAQDFVTCIEKHTGVPVKWIGVGRDRDALITRF